MIERIRRLFKKATPNPNLEARRDQTIIAMIIAGVVLLSYGVYIYTKKPRAVRTKVTEPIHFAGSFDKSFNQSSDESLILKQQKEIDALKVLASSIKEEQKKESMVTQAGPDEETKKIVQALQEKLTHLEETNQKLNEKIQVAFNGQSISLGLKPPSREEQQAKLENQRFERREYYRKAGIETVSFKQRRAPRDDRRPDNYVWAGTFVSGILITGVMGDAGVNGTKNTGTVLIRLDENGTMPNGQRSRLKDCFVLGSSYGDLSGDSVVVHTETLSCAREDLSFELKVYGSVYDQDAMQDVRGTSILQTKPLLGYSAAAGFLAGIGKGVENFGSIQAGPSETLMALNASKIIGRTATDGAISHPAHRVPEYIMKIADLYHPLVVVRAGRRVSVMFIKGFWIDRAHQTYESGKAIDNEEAKLDAPQITTTVTRATLQNNSSTPSLNNLIKQQVTEEMRQKQSMATQNSNHSAEQLFLAKKGIQPMALIGDTGVSR